jgi:hypothetical protein
MDLPKHFVDAPRPEAEDFNFLLDALKPPKLSKKKAKKIKKLAAKRKREAAQTERQLRKEDPGKGYEIRFNHNNVAEFYDDRCVLPAAAHWNMDEFLMVYLSAGIEALLKGYTDWNWSVDGNKPSTRKNLKKVAKLCREHVDMVRRFEDPQGRGDRALRILADIGVGRLWD